MPITIVNKSITQIKCDAIVNMTSSDMKPRNGIDKAIHDAAGPELLKYCKGLGKVSIVSPRITPAFSLPAKNIIHIERPLWRGGSYGEHSLLAACIQKVLLTAHINGYTNVAFPLISSGRRAFPKNIVLKETVSVISDCLGYVDPDMQVYVAAPKSDYDADVNIKSRIEDWVRYCEIEEGIYDNIMSLDEHSFSALMREKDLLYDRLFRDNDRYDIQHCLKSMKAKPTKADRSDKMLTDGRDDGAASFSLMRKNEPAVMSAPRSDVFCSYSIADGESGSMLWDDSFDFDTASLSDILKKQDKGFSDTLFYYIDKKKIPDVEAYKRSNISKQTFSKIKSNRNYKPSKTTAISFAIGLRLDIEETRHLLSTAGMCLSRSDKFDLIIEYFIRTGHYKTISDVNEVLYDYDMNLLGA